jgi:hypothetical protein
LFRFDDDRRETPFYGSVGDVFTGRPGPDNNDVVATFF